MLKWLLPSAALVACLAGCAVQYAAPSTAVISGNDISQLPPLAKVSEFQPQARHLTQPLGREEAERAARREATRGMAAGTPGGAPEALQIQPPYSPSRTSLPPPRPVPESKKPVLTSPELPRLNVD